MNRKSIFLLVLWLILLAVVIAALAMGVKPENLIGEFMGLASPFIVYLTSRSRLNGDVVPQNEKKGGESYGISHSSSCAYCPDDLGPLGRQSLGQ